jgi:hypothetical protein
MQKLAKLTVAPRIIGILFLLHALMLLGADEISSIENGGIRTIRSLGRILTLYRADPEPLLEALPSWLSAALGWVLSMPGWGVFAVIGGALAALFRARD